MAQPALISLPMVEFTVYAKVEPQGSKRAFVVHPKGGGKPRAVVVDDNKATLRTFRQEMTRTALASVPGLPWAAKHVPVRLRLDFYFLKPTSVRNRRYPVVKPDCDKAVRSCFDSLTGVLYVDDCQVVQLVATKNYGDVERVHVKAEILS